MCSYKSSIEVFGKIRFPKLNFSNLYRENHGKRRSYSGTSKREFAKPIR